MVSKKLLVLILGVFMITSALTMVATVPTAQAATQESRIDPTVVDAPDELFVNETVNYQVEIRGAFEHDGEIFDSEEADNWTLRTETDLDATIEPTEEESTVTNVFNVTITVHEEAEGDLVFTAYLGKEEAVYFNERHFRIDAETPERTSLTVTNPTDTHIEEVELGLFIDGELKARKTLEDLGPNEDRQVTFAWSKESLSAGEHGLEVWMDYGFSEEAEFNRDHLIMETTFEIEDQISTWIYGGVAIVVIVGGFFIFIWYQKRKRKRRRPW